MARKQKASMLEKFLDLIGLAEDVKDNKDVNLDDEFDDQPSHGRAASKNNRFNDEFDDEPRMSRVQNRRSASSGTSANDNRFDAAEGWGESEARPEYGARNQQRAQSKARPSSGRYNEQKGGSTGSKNSARYEGTQESGNYYRAGSSSYQKNDYQPGGYRTGSSYGSGSRKYESDPYSAYGDPYANDQYDVGGKTSDQNPARHQTVIFKLHSVDECKGVIMALIEKKSVLLNLDELDSMQAQRTLDTMSGATFAIGAKLSRASDRTWLITPSTVEVNDNPGDPASSGYRSRYSS